MRYDVIHFSLLSEQSRLTFISNLPNNETRQRKIASTIVIVNNGFLYAYYEKRRRVTRMTIGSLKIWGQDEWKIITRLVFHIFGDLFWSPPFHLTNLFTYWLRAGSAVRRTDSCVAAGVRVFDWKLVWDSVDVSWKKLISMTNR